MIPRRPGWYYWEAAELIRDGVLDIGDGYRAKNSEMGSSGLPFARAGNLNNGFHFDDADILGEESVKLAADKLSRPGEITFTSKGTFGRFAFVRNDTPRFVYSPQLCYWRIKKDGVIDRRFLYYWMQGADCMNQLNEVKGLTDMADYVSPRISAKCDLRLRFQSTLGCGYFVVLPISSKTTSGASRF